MNIKKMVNTTGKILYLCNGKNPMCKAKDYCGCLNSFEEPVCFHTSLEEFALNGPLEKSPLECNADKNSKRPLFIYDDGYFWEGFVGEGKLAKIKFKE